MNQSPQYTMENAGRVSFDNRWQLRNPDKHRAPRFPDLLMGLGPRPFIVQLIFSEFVIERPTFLQSEMI